MYDMGTRKRALALVAQGRSLNSVSKETGVSRAAIRSWQSRIEPLAAHAAHPCPGAGDARPPTTRRRTPTCWASISATAASALHTRARLLPPHRLRQRLARPHRRCASGHRRRHAQQQRRVRVKTAGLRDRSRLQPPLALLLPPARPRQEARAHDRPRTLAAGDRRRPPVGVHPGPHPLRRLPDHQLDHPPRRRRAKRYEYPRYFFTNLSADIIGSSSPTPSTRSASSGSTSPTPATSPSPAEPPSPSWTPT